MRCPACHREQQEGRKDCLSCGLIFDKWKAKVDSAVYSTAPPSIKPKILLSKPGVRSSITAIFLFLGSGILGIKTGHPEWLTAGIIAGIFVAALQYLRFSLTQNFLYRILVIARPALGVFLLFGAIFYPYILTPDFLAPLISIGQLDDNLKKYKNRKVRIRGRVRYWEPLSLNSGNDQIIELSLKDKRDSIRLICDAGNVNPLPKKRDTVLVTGVVKSDAGSDPRFVGSQFIYIDEPDDWKGLLEKEDLYILGETLNIPDEIYVLNLTSEVDIPHLPVELKQLSRLESLRIIGAGLKALPSEIGALTRLRNLSVRNNRLSYLPKELFELTSLRKLNLSRNNFTRLPEAITQLTELKELNLSYNKLLKLPKNMKKLAHLETLSLEGNPLPESEIIRIQKIIPGVKITFPRKASPSTKRRGPSRSLKSRR